MAGHPVTQPIYAAIATVVAAAWHEWWLVGVKWLIEWQGVYIDACISGLDASVCLVLTGVAARCFRSPRFFVGGVRLPS